MAQPDSANITEGVAHALKADLERTCAKRTHVERLAMAGPKPREAANEEIDGLWGQ
jgi:hypothetical protein